MASTHKGISYRATFSMMLSAFMVLAVLPVSAVRADGNATPSSVYTDVSADGVHSDNILQLAELGIFEGTDCGDHHFCPWAEIPRWMMAVWIVRMVDATDPEPLTDGATTRFEDIDNDEWWAPFVERLAELGITVGCSQTTFCPHLTTPRGQMASFLSRAYELPEAEPAGFEDVSDGNVHLDNINRLAASGITVGCSAEQPIFCPHAKTSKAQVASFLARALEWQDTQMDKLAVPVVEIDPALRALIENELVAPHSAEFPWIQEAWRHMTETPFTFNLNSTEPYASVGIRLTYSSPLYRVQAISINLRPEWLTVHYLNTILHEMAHVWTLSDDSSERTGPIGAAHLYFSERAREARESGDCQAEELFADAVAALTPKPGTAMGTYWQMDCPGIEAPDREALTVAKAASDGIMPEWITTAHADGDGYLDLEKLWDRIQVMNDYRDEFDAVEWHRSVVVYQLHDSFGGYCSPSQVYKSAFGELDALRNPWRDGGCVPTAPINVTATYTGGEIQVSWEQPFSDGGHALGVYEVEWRLDEEPFDASRGATVPADRTSVSLVVPAANEYWVRVTAVNGLDDDDETTQRDGWGESVQIKVSSDPA